MTIMQLLCTMKVGNLANLVGQVAIPLIRNWLHQGLFQSVTGFPDHQFTSQASSPLFIHITSATDQTKSRTRTPKPVTSKRDLNRPHPLQVGWSELAATNAPVADEPVEAVFRMNENPILPAQIFFFSTSSLPQNFPPSYLPPTNPSPLTPSPELLAPETLSGSELGAWSRLGAGTSLELGAVGAGPTQDPCKHFF
jgi:hypothetical protein